MECCEGERHAPPGPPLLAQLWPAVCPCCVPVAPSASPPVCSPVPLRAPIPKAQNPVMKAARKALAAWHLEDKEAKPVGTRGRQVLRSSTEFRVSSVGGSFCAAIRGQCDAPGDAFSLGD